ncbi:MAG: hypothetical protein JNJ49_17345 [Bdellovibrionaceae bacterium]|nr:hypothetical protein [Pseudobdellovibrionaceae bacterium]
MLKALVGLLLITITLSIGCNRTESPRRSHETARPSETVETPTATTASEVMALSKKETIQVQQFEAALATDRLERQLRSESESDRQMLYMVLKQAAATIENPETSTSARAAVGRAFSAAILNGCSINLSVQLRGCRFLRLFKGQEAATTLAIAAAQSESDVLRRHSLLGIAYNLTNRVDDTRVDIEYIREAPNYEAAINGQPQLQNQHNEILEQALIRVSRSPEAINSIKKLLAERYDVFNLSSPRRSTNTRIDSIVFAIGVDEFIRSNRWRNELSKVLSTANNTVALYNEQLKDRPRLSESLGLANSIPATFETLIFESVWSGRLSPDEAARLLAARGNLDESERERTRTALLEFAQIRFFLAARQVNDVILRFFAKPGSFATANAFQDGLKEGDKGQAIWADTIRRIEALKLFRDRALADTTKSSAVNQRLESYFSGIDQNIRLVSTYPSMLLLSYHLARLKFSLKIFTWTGLLEIHAGTILEYFFSGGLTPWFPYSNDRSPIQASQIPIVVHYALELGLFSGGGADPATFVDLLATQMAGSLKSDVEKIDRAFEKHYELDPRITEFHRICKVQEQRTATKNPRYASPSITLDQFRRFTIVGMPEGYGSDAQHSSLLAAWSFYGTEATTTKMRLDENLEVIRLEYTRTLERIQHIERMIKTHLERHQSAGREQTIASMRSSIVPLENLKKQVYTRIFRINKTISQCGEMLARAELSAQKQILVGLESHLRDVHRAMSKARVAGLTGVGKEFGFSGKVALPGLDEHETKLGYTTESFRASKLQLLLRARSILENGFSTASGEIGQPMRDQNSIQIPARLRDVTESLRSEVISIEWSESEDQFVNRGIRLIMPDRDALFYWPEFNSTIISIRSRIRSLAALTKAGVQDTNDGPQSFSAQELIRSTLEMENWLEMDATWKRVLNLTGRYSRFSLDSMLDTFAWGGTDHTFYGLLDNLFKQITADKLGENQGDVESTRYRNRVGVIAEFADHSMTMNALGQPMLAIPTETLRDLDQVYRHRVDSHLESMATFLSIARQLEARRSRSPEAFPSWRIFSSRPAPQVPILRATLVENYRAEIAEMARQTGYKAPESFTRASGQ